ncbi:MAG: 50S ribosomal protein L18 [Eubacteriales bacterium]|nr:50S ribosomal protein L18 [Eubacteriales bacterium]
MINKVSKNEVRKRIHARVRRKISGSSERPRLCVYRSNKQIYCQMIDDLSGHTLCQASSLDPEVKGELEHGSNVDAAKVVGTLIAKRAKAAGIDTCVFDRGGYLYHGRVKALAEAARDGGLEF